MSKIIIADKGKVTLSDRETWHLSLSDLFWDSINDEQTTRLASEFYSLVKSHQWIEVWSLRSGSETTVGELTVLRFSDFSRDYVTFRCSGRNSYMKAWPVYRRGENDRLIKVLPSDVDYSDDWGAYDRDYFFELDQIKAMWNAIVAKLRAMRLVESAPFGLSWQGRVWYIVRQLIEQERYQDAMEVAYCAWERAEQEYDVQGAVVFRSICDGLLALDKLPEQW